MLKAKNDKLEFENYPMDTEMIIIMKKSKINIITNKSNKSWSRSL